MVAARQQPQALRRLVDQLGLGQDAAADVEYWPTPDPTIQEGNREQRLDAYREVRDQLMRRIRERFATAPAGNE